MSDNNYPPGDFSGTKGQEVGPLTLEPLNGGAEYDDIFKNSKCLGNVFYLITVKAPLCRENAWDANNGCRGNHYVALDLHGGPDAPAVYLKDGFCENKIDDVIIRSYAKHSDWFEGDYSSTGGRKCKGNTRNNVRRADGEPVRVRWVFTRAEKPVFTNSKVRYMWFWSIVSTIYVEVKYLIG